MDYATDELKQKIDKARMALSAESRAAIDSVDWKSVIIGMRESKKYSFSQIEALGTATETILAGLMSGKEYKQELKNKMALSEDEANKLVAEMNDIVFKKIKENLVKKLGEQRTTTEVKILKPEISPEDTSILASAGISLDKDTDTEKPEEKMENKEDMIAKIENTDLIKKPAIPLVAAKLTSSFQIPAVKTDHASPTVPARPTQPVLKKIVTAAKPTLPTEDPYREPTE